jgi:hypothetical protein
MEIVSFATAVKNQFAGTGERFDVTEKCPEEGKEVYVWHKSHEEGHPSSCGVAWYSNGVYEFSTITQGIKPCKFPVYWQYKRPHRTLEEDQWNARSVRQMADEYNYPRGW